MNSAFFILEPVQFKNICKIYPPKVRDIAINDNAIQFIKLLTVSQEELIDPLVLEDKPIDDVLTPFETLLNLAYNTPQLQILIKEAIHFFTHEECLILPTEKMILIGNIQNATDLRHLKFLTEDNYFEFQNMIREACGNKPKEPFDFNIHPWKLRMDAKARYRDKIKAKKSGLSFNYLMLSICCMGIGITPLNIGELSYAALGPLMATYQNKEKYEIDIDSLLAGADAKKIKPEYWIKNLTDE